MVERNIKLVGVGGSERLYISNSTINHNEKLYVYVYIFVCMYLCVYIDV